VYYQFCEIVTEYNITMQNIEISESRIADDIDRIAACTESDPTVGYSRPTFSPAWKEARDYVVGEAERAGCVVKIDPAGNVHARPGTLGWDKPAWLCGSHLDSVPSGGKFDGVVGVVAALEIIRANRDAELELVIFAEEEGTTFGIAMLGSRIWAGTVGADRIRSLKNRDGVDFASAGKTFGVVPERISREGFGFPFERYRGLIEVHVEQGAGLWKQGTPVAVVTAVNGRRQYVCRTSGVPNHAGSTGMADRFDALAGAAQIVLGLESLGHELNGLAGNATLTVGGLTITPNAINVIPGNADLLVDFRASSNDALQAGDRRIRQLVASVGEKRGLGTEIDCFEDLPALPLDPGVCEKLHHAASSMRLSLPDVSSGALHDTAILAPYLPAALLFVASRDGISHNPNEYSRTGDIATAARIVAAAIS